MRQVESCEDEEADDHYNDDETSLRSEDERSCEVENSCETAM